VRVRALLQNEVAAAILLISRHVTSIFCMPEPVYQGLWRPRLICSSKLYKMVFILFSRGNQALRKFYHKSTVSIKQQYTVWHINII
jgi:hypothetical protein